jgi:hypothetical protein
MNLSYSQIVTSFTIWEFLSELTKPFTQMDIYKAGIIDANGKFLKDPQDYKTQQEMRAGNPFYRLIVVLKRALRTSSDPMVRYAMTNPMAAMTALSEEVDSLGGDGEYFLSYIKPIIEEMSVGGGGIVGVGVSADKPEDVVVTPAAALRHKKRVKKGVGRKLFENLLLEAKRVVQTTGHMTHVGDFLYHGNPATAIRHLESSHRRFATGRQSRGHRMSLKADGGMSVVIKRHADGTPAVAYKTGAAEYRTEKEIEAVGKPHLTAALVPALNLARRLNLKPGTAVQGDLLFAGGEHGGRTQPNAINYSVPKEATIGFAPHSQYKTDGGTLDLRKTGSHVSGLAAEGAYIPNLAITKKTRLGLTPERAKVVSSSIAQAKKILGNRDLVRFARGLPQDKKFHRMVQEYSNEAARTTGVRSVKGLTEFIPTHMGKASQRGLSERTRKAMTDSFARTIQQNAKHLEGLFTAHGHINAAKHALLDQFGTHYDQFDLRTHGGEEHEGFVSAMGRPGMGETQAKFVREGPGGFPEKNVKNAIIRFGKAPEA